MCVAGYAGAYASNEVNNITSENLETVNLETADKVDFAYNCWTSMTVRRDGKIKEVTQNTEASSSEDCNGQAAEFKQLYMDAGYEVSDQITIYG